MKNIELKKKIYKIKNSWEGINRVEIKKRMSKAENKSI